MVAKKNRPPAYSLFLYEIFGFFLFDCKYRIPVLVSIIMHFDGSNLKNTDGMFWIIQGKQIRWYISDMPQTPALGLKQKISFYESLCSQRFHLASCEERNDNNHNIRSDNFLICYFKSNRNYSESWCKSFNVSSQKKFIHFEGPTLRHLSPRVCTTKRRSMDPERAGTQGFGIQGNVKLLTLTLKYRDFQNVKNSEILRMTSTRCSPLLILILTGNVTIQCFWIEVWKVWNWTYWAGSGTTSLVCFSKPVKWGQQSSHNEFKLF